MCARALACVCVHAQTSCPRLSIKYLVDYFIPSNAHQVFWDLNNSYEDCTVPLKICEEEVLGKGGYGFVCKGQLVPEVSMYRDLYSTYYIWV